MPLSASTQPISVSRPPAPALHIDFLDGLRGLAALYVVLFHFLYMREDGIPYGLSHGQLRVASLAQAGHSAVTVFMVLSGFSLMLPVARAANGQLKGGAVGFLKRRARRIIPPYYAALLLSLLGLVLSPAGLAYLHGVRDPRWLTDFTAPNLLSHLLLVHDLSPAWSGKINLALWSIGTEWQIYFTLPFILLPVWRRGGVRALLAAGMAVGVAPIFLRLFDSPFYIEGGWYAGVFGIGAAGAVWGWQGLSDAPGRPAMRRRALIGLAVLAVAYVFACKYVAPTHTLFINAGRNYLDAVLKDYLLGGMIVCVLIFGSLSRDLPKSPAFAPFRLLETSAARTLGAFSYSLYLTHCVVLKQADTLIVSKHISPMMAFDLKAVLGIPIAIGLAYGFHLVFERPFMVSSGSRNMRLLAEAPPQPVA